MNTKTKTSVLKLTQSAMLAALSILLMTVVRFPFPAAPFLEYDMADVPILIGTMLFGPLTGSVILLITSIIQAITVSASSGWVGFVMHFVASGALVIIFGLIYKKMHNIKGLVLGLLAGSVAMVIIMIPLNLLLTGYFMGTPIDAVKSMIVPILIPFNAMKAGINSVVSALVFIPLNKVLEKTKLVAKN